MIECTQEKYNILKSSIDNIDVTVLIAKHAVQDTYYQSNNPNSLILTVMTECTQEKYNILKSSIDNIDVTVLIAKHAVEVTYYQSNHPYSLILTWPRGPKLEV